MKQWYALYVSLYSYWPLGMDETFRSLHYQPQRLICKINRSLSSVMDHFTAWAIPLSKIDRKTDIIFGFHPNNSTSKDWNKIPNLPVQDCSSTLVPHWVTKSHTNSESTHSVAWQATPLHAEEMQCIYNVWHLLHILFIVKSWQKMQAIEDTQFKMIMIKKKSIKYVVLSLWQSMTLQGV